jgi:flagellum-specific ATP synthase
MSGLKLKKPKLMSWQTATDRIAKTWMMDVTGQVASVSGDCIEVRGMTAPVGAICELRGANGQRCFARVIGFRNVHPVLSPMERIDRLAAGDSVRLADLSLKLRVGPALCGRVLKTCESSMRIAHHQIHSTDRRLIRR